MRKNVLRAENVSGMDNAVRDDHACRSGCSDRQRSVEVRSESGLLSGAIVVAGRASGVTDAAGHVSLSLPEGSTSVSADWPGIWRKRPRSLSKLAENSWS